MAVFECGRCLPVNVPDEWTVAKKSEVAELARKTSPIFAIVYFRPIEMSLQDAKGVALHIAREKGFCHKCRTELPEYEGNCQKCKSLNLNW